MRTKAQYIEGLSKMKRNLFIMLATKLIRGTGVKPGITIILKNGLNGFRKRILWDAALRPMSKATE